MFGYTRTNEKSKQGIVTISGVPVENPDGEEYFCSLLGAEPSVNFYSQRLCELALSQTYDELMKAFASVSVSQFVEWDPQVPGLDLWSASFVKHSSSFPFKYGPHIVFHFAYNVDDWKGPWTMREQASQFMTIFESYNVIGAETGYYDEENVLNGYEVTASIDDTSQTFGLLVAKYFPAIERAHKQAILDLQSRVDAHTVTIPFVFPSEVKVACEQYLVYFVQFLADVGIEATADIQEAAGQVLFSVTPTNKDEALDHIREALAVYLQLPSNPNLAASVSSDLDVQRLTANIYHLNGQLTLAGIAIQQKDALLELKDGIIQQQRQVIDGQILLTSINKETDDSEPLVTDMVSVKRVEAYGVEFDLPTILRKLKERFKKKK